MEVRLLLVVLIGLQINSPSKAVTMLQLVQPVEGSVCPGDDVIFTCTVFSTNLNNEPPTLQWLSGDVASVSYFNQQPPSSVKYSAFTTSVAYTNNNYTISSNATLRGALLSHNNQLTTKCRRLDFSADTVVKSTLVAGAVFPPLQLSYSRSSATLTWLPPPNTSHCVFNYTVNITSSSSSSMIEQVYNNLTSLTLTHLTPGEKYSVTVAVTDSTGQHGPSSEQLHFDLSDIVASSVSSSSLLIETSIHNQQFTESMYISPSLTTLLITTSVLQESNAAIDQTVIGNCIIHSVVGFITGGVMSAIAATLITSCILWCVVIRRGRERKEHLSHKQQRAQESPPVELVEYEVPVLKDQEIDTQDNKAYESVITLQTNQAYEQVHVNH